MKFASKILTPILALNATLYSFSALAFNNLPSQPHISTTGYGKVVATPDMAEFSGRVEVLGVTAEQAKNSVDKVVTSLLNKLIKLGVDKSSIQSSNLYLTPKYDYPKDGKPELVGYHASRNITVEVKQLSMLNEYMDTAIDLGINQLDNIQLKVSNKNKYQEQARLNAIKDAREKAKSLALGFERDLGQVWRVDYNSQSPQPFRMSSMAMNDMSESKSYEDSTITISDSVNVIYLLEQSPNPL